MALSAFTDKSHAPTEADLRSVLGTKYAAWVRLVELVTARIPALTQLWGFTGKSTGWGLRLHHGKRVIVYMTPADAHSRVSFALGEKAVAQAKLAGLPKALLDAIEAAPRYAEGRGVRIQVTKLAQLPALAALAEIKDRS